MKKRYLLGGVLATFLLLTGCAKDNTPTEVKSLPFYNHNAYYTLNAKSLDTFYVDGSLVPYVSVKNYIETMDGVLESSNFSYSSNVLFGEYIVKSKLSNQNLSIIFDYKNDRILTVYDYAFQNTKDISSTIDYAFNLKSETKSVYPGKIVTLDLASYDFNMRYINGNCLVPFQIMNALFGGLNYNSTYYTGNAYYNTYFSLAYADNGKELLKEIRSNVNSDLDNQELRESNYNYLCFYMDNLYGLKEYKNFTSFDRFLSSEAKEQLKSTDPNKYMKGYASLVKELDECHTSIHNYSYNSTLENISFVEGDFATPNFVKHKKASDELLPLAKAYYGEDLKNKYEIVDDTCYIFFKNFETGDNAKVKDSNGNILDTAYLYDTYYLFYKAFEDIKTKSNVKNVVIDLSVNGGGNGGAQYRSLGFLSNSFVVSSRDALTGIAYSLSYRIDTNNDGKFDSNDGYPDYNYYILTSNYTYSAANLFTHIAKENNTNIKVIGEQAGGGGCSIIPFLGIDGACLQVSSYNQNVTIKEAGTSYTYTILEDGKEVDKAIDYNNYYDREYINNLIKTL